MKLFEIESGTELTFVDWMRNGEGIFHVLGKPGSGKSTLMKFIWEHSISQDMLRQWASPSQLLTMAYFFWKPDPSQNGLRNLKMSIVRSALEQAPELRDGLLPSSHSAKPITSLTDKQISQAFDLVTSSPTILERFKIFLLIDGLDEFDEERNAEDHYHLVRLLQTWSLESKGKVKICVSSREEVAFSNVTHHQKIRLQNLTRQDIQAYVTQQLKTHHRFSELEESCKQMGQKDRNNWSESHICNVGCLIYQIVDISDGIFLWVRLVMVQVRKCMSAECCLRTLWQHADAQPKPLDDFLNHMLNSILPMYQKQAHILLAIICFGNIFDNFVSPWNRISIEGASFLCEKDNQISDRPDYQQSGQNILGMRKEDWPILTAEEIAARFNGLIEVSKYASLVLTHRSIVEVLHKDIDTKLLKVGITKIELSKCFCQLLIGEIRAPHKIYTNEIMRMFVSQKLTRFYNDLERLKTLKEPSIFQQLDQLEDTCALVFGTSYLSEKHWQEFHHYLVSPDSGNSPYTPLLYGLHYAISEVLLWILKMLNHVPKRGYLASILLWYCTRLCHRTSLIGALLKQGYIGVNVLGVTTAPIRKQKCHITGAWISSLAFIIGVNSIGPDRKWTSVKRWLDYGADPRISLYGRKDSLRLDDLAVKTNGKWFKLIPSVRRNFITGPFFRLSESLQTPDLTLREYIAKSRAHNKERLLELIDRNTAWAEADEAAGNAALFEELPSPEVLDVPDYTPPPRTKMDIWRANALGALGIFIRVNSHVVGKTCPTHSVRKKTIDWLDTGIFLIATLILLLSSRTLSLP